MEEETRESGRSLLLDEVSLVSLLLAFEDRGPFERSLTLLSFAGTGPRKRLPSSSDEGSTPSQRPRKPKPKSSVKAVVPKDVKVYEVSTRASRSSPRD